MYGAVNGNGRAVLRLYQERFPRIHQGYSTFSSAGPHTYCKELLPAPGNRSNKRRDREKDLATTEEKKLGTREERVTKKAGVVKSRHG
ncbi:hypothetical protein TNCV_1266121 [Trichonephila clavipes]|nr:hypothetical protein TNCV_1266121 [Trichonephila clavipes]